MKNYLKLIIVLLAPVMLSCAKGGESGGGNDEPVEEVTFISETLNGDLKVKPIKMTLNFQAEEGATLFMSSKEKLVRLELELENEGEDGQWISSSAFELEDTKNNTEIMQEMIYSPEDALAKGGKLDNLEEPGGKCTGAIYFTVREDAKAEELKLFYKLSYPAEAKKVYVGLK